LTGRKARNTELTEFSPACLPIRRSQASLLSFRAGVADRAVAARLRFGLPRLCCAGHYTQQVIGETLAELGYEVETGFAILSVEGGVAHIQRPD
jgi:hypothetical protein